MPYSSLLHPESLFLWQATVDPYLHRKCSNTVLSLSLWSPWVLVCTRFVWAFWASLEEMVFGSKCEFAPSTILLGLLIFPWTWGISSQLLQGLPSYWDFSDLERGVSSYSQSSEAQPQLLTLDVGYLLSAARHSSKWTFRLLLCLGCCKYCCNKHWGTCILLNYGFLQIYAQEWDCWIIWHLCF